MKLIAPILRCSCLFLLGWLLCACVPEVVQSLFSAEDLRPPSLLSWQSSGTNELLLVFDEPVQAAAADFRLGLVAEDITRVVDGSGLAGFDVLDLSVTTEGQLRLRLAAAVPPGAALALSGLASDLAGNSTSFTLPLWGYNPQPAALLINEIISAGSDSHPDVVELYVTRAGNLAGLCLYMGLADDYDLRYVFASCQVAAGEYLVLHLKPQGLDGELDELEAVDVSIGLDAYQYARDFWCHVGVQLPGKNGVLSLYDSPYGTVLDALLYSERGSDSDTRYRGFGTAAFLARAEALVASGGWLAAEGVVRPEDAADSAAVTSTRTLGRSSTSADTDAAADWHVVPTRGASIGRQNTDERYQP